MKFFTNKIPTNSSGSFSDLIQKVAGSNDKQVKTASTEEVVEAEVDNKVVEAEAGVDDDGEGKRTNVHHEEGSANDQNGEPEEDGENKTVDPAGLSEASSDDEVKIASDEGDSAENVDGKNTGRFPDEFEPKQEAEDDGKADVKASGKKQTKEAGELPEALKEHQFGKKDDDKDDDDDKTDSEGNADADGKDDDADKEGGMGCAASDDPNFQKIANLTGPEKNRLKEYFRRYYPERYADALTQDK
jgi:hypothetical protein